MNKFRTEKLQHLLITQLLAKGVVQLALPDGIKLEIGITQEGKDGSMEKTDDYCYVVATREANAIALDSYNLGLQYDKSQDAAIYESESVEEDGTEIHRVDVI